jgi:hypothetical protein
MVPAHPIEKVAGFPCIESICAGTTATMPMRRSPTRVTFVICRLAARRGEAGRGGLETGHVREWKDRKLDDGGHARIVSRRPIPLTLPATDGKLTRVKNRKRGVDRATSRSLVARLNRDAEKIAWRFGLRYRSIEAERANVKSRYGICYEDGVIKIRLRHAVTGQPLLYSSLVSTLCHELAHLRHFNHGVRFRAFNMELLEFAREQGIYRPGRRPSRPTAAPRRESQQPEPNRADRREQDEHRPVQLSLF